VHRLPREVLRKDRHRTSTKFRLGVIRCIHKPFKRTSYIILKEYVNKYLFPAFVVSVGYPVQTTRQERDFVTVYNVKPNFMIQRTSSVMKSCSHTVTTPNVNHHSPQPTQFLVCHGLLIAHLHHHKRDQFPNNRNGMLVLT
jgi:hypothetical protein